MEPKFCPFMSTQEKKVLCVPSCALCIAYRGGLSCAIVVAAVSSADMEDVVKSKNYPSGQRPIGVPSP